MRVQNNTSLTTETCFKSIFYFIIASSFANLKNVKSNSHKSTSVIIGSLIQQKLKKPKMSPILLI